MVGAADAVVSLSKIAKAVGASQRQIEDVENIKRRREVNIIWLH
jgi:hypothetical protein